MKAEPKRRALGKGLASLIPDSVGIEPLGGGAVAAPTVGEPPGGPIEIPISRIRPNPHQPRRRFNDAEIDELAESIRQSGMIQPLLARPEADGSFTLVTGERRLRAAQRIGLATAPAILHDYPDDRLLELALVENLQRDDLGPLETARAFRSLVRDFGLTQAEVAQRIGKPRSTVANFLRLLDLPRAVQELLDAGAIDMGHGRALAGIEDPALQERLAVAAARAGWSVREVEERTRRALAAGDRGAPTEAPRRDPNVVAAEQALARALEAGVAIRLTRSRRGRIEIRFAGDDDLDRLYRVLMRASKKAAP